MRLAAALLFCSALLSAQSLTLSVENQGQIRPGNTLQVKATLSGAPATSMAAFQFNLRSTVAGTWAVTPGSSATAAGKQFTCVASDPQNPADWKCILVGLNANVLPDGVVGNITLDIPANAPTGQVSLIPSNLYAASAAGDAVALTSNTPNFILASPLSKCDLNSDGVTNVQDVQLVVAQILGPLAMQVTDLNGDGRTTVVEYQIIQNAATGGACKVTP